MPSGTAALALNVTAVGATQQTNLRFFPTGTPLPTTANLNPTPGAPPTPNAVTVSLNDAGKFSVYNAFGTVAVIVDVVGVYDDHHHDDRYYTKEQVDQSIADFGNSFVVAVTVGNGEGVGNSVCSGAGTEIKARNARGQLVDTRFSFTVPGYAYGQVRGDGSIRNATSELSSVEHPATGEYCLVFAGAQPSQIQQEATVASVTAES